ncbi:MAG TPA: trigger factor, partial [Acidimicrobiales bacterium]|nr:trigger factor [Acidimicrobiales bacterium]
STDSCSDCDVMAAAGAWHRRSRARRREGLARPVPAREIGSPFRMKAEVTPLEGNKVKVAVQVEEAEVEQALAEAFGKLAREVRVPGFRPGKVPRQVLEARIGRARVRQEAFREHIPGWYAQAVQEHTLDVITQPEVEVTAGEDGGALAFDAVVEIRPRLKVQGYQRLKIVIPNPEVSEREVDAQVDRLRANFAELVPVEREARKGDQVVVDMSASRAGEALASMSYTDYSVDVGSGNDLPELEEHLAGARAGDTIRFQADLNQGAPAAGDKGGKTEAVEGVRAGRDEGGQTSPAKSAGAAVGGEQATEPVLTDVEVVVKQVQEKVLPDPSDEWAAEASEFSSLEDLQEDIRQRLSAAKWVQATLSLQSGIVDALVELVHEDPPRALVDEELEERVSDLGSRLDNQGVSLERYLEVSGRSLEEILAEMRARSVPAVRADLALRAVAESEGLEPSEVELDQHIHRLAARAGTDPAILRQQVDRRGQRLAVLSDLRKSKAFDWLVEHAEIIDEEGHPVDRELLKREGRVQTGSQPLPGDQREAQGQARRLPGVQP